MNLNDSMSVTGLTGDSVKLVKTAAIKFKVKNVEESIKTVATLTQKYSGRIYSQNFQSTADGRKELKVSIDSILTIETITPGAEITVRVPSTDLESFLFDVAHVGYYTENSQMDIEDKSLLYLESKLRQNNREDVVASSKKNDWMNVLQKIAVRDEAIQEFIANKMIDGDVAYSTVSLHLFQNAFVKKEMIANYDLADYDLPFSERLGNSLNTGWSAFLNFLLVVLHLWPFILVSILGFLLYRYYQRVQRKVTG